MGKKHSNFRFQCYAPNYPEQIELLSQLARPERWDYLHDPQDIKHKILVNYIDHTYMRLKILHKKFPDKNYMFFSEKNGCCGGCAFDSVFVTGFALYSMIFPHLLSAKK